jgi:hypothetical protein
MLVLRWMRGRRAEFGGICMNCDQCQALMINNVFCHETRCPNAKKTWIPERGEWVRFVECFYCGCEVEEGETCCPEWNTTPEEEEY